MRSLSSLEIYMKISGRTVLEMQQIGNYSNLTQFYISKWREKYAWIRFLHKMQRKTNNDLINIFSLLLIVYNF